MSAGASPAELSPNAVIRRVERELTELWTAPPAAGELPKARACTMNLVVVAPPELAERYTTVVDDVTQNIPARAIIVSLDPKAADRLEGDVTAVCLAADRHAICSERVTLRASGAVCARVGSAIEAICVPELSTSLVWLGDVRADDPLFLDVAENAQRVIIDSEYTSTASLLEVARWARGDDRRGAFADLAWTRLAVWQEMCARFFDEPGHTELASKVTRLELCQASDRGSPIGPEAALLVGWMATRLGWTIVARDGALRVTRADGRDVEVRFGAVARPKAVAPLALAKLVLTAEADGMTLKGSIERSLASGIADDSPDADVLVWTLEAPDKPPMTQRVRLRTNRGARLLERTLHRPVEDPALVESSALVEALVSGGAKAT